MSPTLGPERPDMWVFQPMTSWTITDKKEETVPVPLQRRLAETFGEPSRSANLWIPDVIGMLENKTLYWISADMQAPNRRAVLVGDAVHPMMFRKWHLLSP